MQSFSLEPAATTIQRDFAIDLEYNLLDSFSQVSFSLRFARGNLWYDTAYLGALVVAFQCNFITLYLAEY